MEKKKLTIKEIGLKRLVIICIAGILLILVSVPDMLSPSGGKKKQEADGAAQEGGVTAGAADAEEAGYAERMEKKLEAALNKVQGIGRVDVIIALKGTKERVTLKDTPYKQESVNEADSGGGSRISSSVDRGDETVLVNSGEGEAPYVLKELEPEVSGVVVIAQGGNNPEVIREINSAMEVLFGIPVHKIKVMKMVDEGKLP